MSRAPEYWREKLAGAPPTLPIAPFVSTDAVPESHGTGVAAIDLPARATDRRIEERLAAFVAFLYRSTRQADLVLGVAVTATDELLPLRLELSDRPSFAELVARVEARLAEAREHAAPIAEIAAACGKARASELFSVAFAVPGSRASLAGLTLVLRPSTADASARFEYDACAMTEAHARALAARLDVLWEACTGEPERSIGTVAFLPAEERERVLVEWNAKEADFPLDATLHGLFEAKADETPDAIAVSFGGKTLTYRELDERANRVAHHLATLGVGPDSLVGVSVERSFEMVVGLVGLAKAGGAYLPMDPAYPKDRLEYMLTDSKVSVVLTQKHLADTLPFGKSDATVVFLDADAHLFERHAPTRPSVAMSSQNLAYVIYTSGSTGAPKGVVLNHQGRVNNFLDFNRRFAVGQGDALIALASLSFDMCAYDVFGTLAAGATIVLPAPAEMQDPVAWARLMNERSVTTWHTAPAMLKMLVDHLEAQPSKAPQSLRLVLLGGDWIPVSLPDRLRALVPGATVVSMGGATECSMDSTIYVIDEVDPSWNSIPYGEPMWNQRAYVLDEDLQPLPVGVPGELFLGGIGVGRGYLERPQLTAERFLDDPFHTDARIAHQRMYRTGDLARWMPDGNLELLGRLDNQVKIRGYRIELGEIEARLNAHPAVKEGVVIARDDVAGEKRLMAYFVQDPAWTGPDDAEADAGTERIEEWQAVYDNAYAANADVEAEGADDVDPTFNIVSWDSSYTNRPIPEEEMRVWVEQTVDRISRNGPDEVLEIGCGMGLLLFRIAPSCSRYVGSDFSKVALNYVRHHADKSQLSQVELESRWADDFDGIADGSLDTVVLNSIILDFPSVDYLMDVLRGAAKAVRSGGTIFVGDVRSLPLCDTYQTSVQVFQADGGKPLDEIRARVARLVRQEEELLIDPRFFEWLPTAIPELAGVRVQLKRGAFTNELNAYRYDVTLYVGESVERPSGTPLTLDWSDVGSLDALRSRLASDAPGYVVIHGVPNARTLRDARTVALVNGDDAPASVAALRAELDALGERDGTGVQPESVWKLAEGLGYAADLRWTNGEGAKRGEFDIALVKGGAGEDARVLFPERDDPDGPGATRSAADFANNPTMGKLSRQLGPELKRHLAARLPEYMVPTVYVPLDAFPLSPNGKVDRKRLPEPDTSRPDMQSPYVAPEDPVQELVAGIWTDVLGLDRVGVEDAFLDLGGHSILAVQIQARLNEIFPFGINLPDIFESRTVARLSDLIRGRGRDAGIDAEEIATMLLEIDELSDEEIEAQIGQ